MLKKRAYLQIENFNDALAVQLLCAEHPMLDGYFVEESQYPWKLWLAVSASIAEDESFLKTIPWKLGNPEGKVKKIQWGSILKKIVLEPDRSQRVKNRILVKTESPEVFVQIIHKHFQIQQGQIFFVSPDKKNNFYLIKITNPSLWCLRLAEEVGDLEIYNESEDIEQLFIRQGWQQRNQISSTTLNLQGNSAVLLDENSVPQSYITNWTSAHNIIDIDEGKSQVLQGDEAQRITVPLRLIEDDHKVPSLWKVEDHSKLIKVISQIHHNQLAGFRAWFDQKGTIFIMSEGRLADSMLKSQLSNVFKSYVKWESRTFFPNGKILMPALPEKMLLKTYDCRGNYLCFDEDAKGKMYIWYLKTSELKDLTFFLQYTAQRAIRQIDSFQDQWNLKFTDIIPNAIVVIKDSGGKKGIEIKEDVAPVQKKVVKKAVRKKKGVIENYSEYITKLKEVDSLLVEDIGNADLWKQRGQISFQLGNQLCGLISLLTSCIISYDHTTFLSQLEKYSDIKNVNIPELFDRDFTSEGKILAKIRDAKMYNSELNYALQLYFAHRFQDEDVRNNAISAMRMGYTGTEYKFHIFEDFDKSVEKVAQTAYLEEEEITNIKKKVIEFLSILKKAKLEQRVVIERQFALILHNNFGRNLLNLEEADPSSWIEEWQEILQYLQNYHSINIDKAEDNFKIWLEKLSLKDIKNTNFEDIFTGDVYRPVFNFDFKKETMEKIQVLYTDYSNGGKEWRDEFSKRYTAFDNAKNQRKLLYLVMQYGPLPDFEEFIYDFAFGDIHFNTIIMNCDIYRLHLMFNKKINEKQFFDEMLSIFPRPNSGYSLIDFCDGMENVILCLFLSSYKKRDDIFVQAFIKILEWIDFYPSYLTELLTLVAFLQIGIVYHKLPDSASAYNFYARKKSLWMNHANYISQNGWAV